MQRLIVQSSGRQLLRKIYKQRWNYIMALPMLVFFSIFAYVPMYGVTLAFKEYMIKAGIFGSPWIGLSNFEQIIGSDIFLRTVRNTLLISIYRIIWGFPMPILFALFLNEVKNLGFKKVVQTISYMPHFVSWVIIGGIVTELLSPTRGAVNALLALFGVAPIYFMTEPVYFRSILVVTGIWKEIGWSSIIYLAAIAGISVDQYEAAEIDGASRIQRIRYITLPSILSVVAIQFILNIGGILNGGFDQVFNLYNSTVYSTGDIIDTYAYRVGMQGNMEYSMSTAISLFKNVIGLMLVMLANFGAKKASGGDYRIW